MKKFIKSFCLSLIILPCVILLSACSSQKMTEELNTQYIYEIVREKGYEGTFDEFLLAIKGDEGRGIADVEKIQSNNGVDTYLITYTDDTISTFTITNGKDGNGIVSIVRLEDIKDEKADHYTYRILYTNGLHYDFKVYNGEDGKDGVSIEEININDKGELEITMTNSDTPLNLGNIKGENGRGIASVDKTSSNGIDTYKITYTDDTTFQFTVTNGKDGRGIESITQAEIIENGVIVTEVVVCYTDGTQSEPFYIHSGKDGEKGENGVGITNIEYLTSEDGKATTIEITYGEDERVQTFTINHGIDGEAGKDGRGIKAIAKTSISGLEDTYTITYTDNSTTTFSVTNGKNGVSVTSAEIKNNELWISLSDGKTINVGNVKGETGNGIDSIEKTQTNGLEDTYTITYTNGNTTTFTIMNGSDGRGIKEIKKESNGLVDSYTITYTDDTEPYTFTITNGKDGLSAYEIYKIYNPTYTKTEAEWIIDLANGDLSTNRYTVSFDSNGGSEVPSQTSIKFGGKARKPDIPVREGYVFDGWYYEDEKWSFIGYSVTEDITLKAKWMAETYNLTLIDESGSTTTCVTYNENFTLPAHSEEGYIYSWKDENGNKITSGVWLYTTDMVLTITKELVPYSITYYVDDELWTDDVNSYTIESACTLPTPTKDGYFFCGWYDNEGCQGEAITKIENGSFGNKTFYGEFNNTLTIKLNANGGQCDTESVQVVYQQEFSLPTPVAPDGYLFDCWVYNVTMKDGEISSYTRLSDDVWKWTDIEEVVAIYSAIFTVESNTIIGLSTIGKKQNVIDIPSQIDGVEITALGDSCFYNNSNINEIYIPSTITSIGFRSIYGLTNLTKIYYNIANLADLKEAENGNFTNCGTDSDGYNLTIGKDVACIPAYFMYNSENGTTNNVVSITFEEGGNCLTVGNYAFANTNITEITLPNTIQSYGNYIFKNCSKLASVSGFMQGIKKINDYTFIGCSSLEAFEIPNGVTTIGKSAFSDCTSLTEINIPNSVTTIEKFAFADCTKVQILTIGENVESIDNYAFRNLTSLETFNYNAKNLADFREKYENTDYGSVILENNWIFTNLGSAKSGTTLYIGENVKKIPAYMFYAPDGIPNIQYINYAENGALEAIGKGAFVGLPAKSLTIPNTVKYIGYRAFCDMRQLEKIVFNSAQLSAKVEGTSELSGAFSGAGASSSGVTFIFGEEIQELNEYHVRLFKHNVDYPGVTNIKVVDFSQNDKIQTIPQSLFKYTYWLKTIILSSSITTIEADVFYSESETTHLQNVYYMGSQAEYANISVDNTDELNKYFISANVYYYAELNSEVSNGFDNYWYFSDGKITTWSPEKYTITYNLFDGLNNKNNPEIFTAIDGEIVLQAPTKENYEFAGWFTDSNFENQIATITESKDYTLYAKWI